MLVALSCWFLAGVASARQSTPEADERSDDGKSGLLESLAESEFRVGLRYRLEAVSDDGARPDGTPLDDALASTLRTELAVQTGRWRGISIHLAAEDVSVLGGETYNNLGAGDLANGRTDRAVVADPDSTEISQAVLEISPGGDDSRFRAWLGRQEIQVGRQRFLGPVGWRQNHQELDAATFALRAAENVRIEGGWLDRVHTVTGADLPMGSAFLRGELERGGWRLAAYSFWLDYERPEQWSLSSRTIGGRAELDLGRVWTVAVEWARQDDHGENPAELELDYRAGEVGWKTGPVSLHAGFEWLEGDGVRGFRTPLATLHKFNGFADRFLVTPPTGLEDLYLGATGSVSRFSWLVRYHRFGSTEGSVDYADELDVTVSRSAEWGQVFALKAAIFSADEMGSDVTKLMAWTSFSF